MDLDKQSYNIQELICLIGADLPQDIKENDLLTALLISFNVAYFWKHLLSE